MIRTIWVGVSTLVATLICSPIVIITALFSKSSPLIEWAIRLWGRTIVHSAGITLRGEDLDRLDPARRYILVANHHSYLDIPCVLTAIPQPVRFMAKKSLFQIPLFGRALRLAGFIPIDRKNRSRNLESFGLAGERIRKGNTIVVFPEEGRSRELGMRQFQRGAFLLALKSGLPIVPVAIHGTYDVLPATRLIVRPGPVTIRVGTPIETGDLAVSSKNHLMETTRSAIETMLREDSIDA